MARFPRIMQKIFGQNAGSQQISQFGSLAAGSPTFTSDPETIQALSQFLDGWYGAIQGAANPAIEDMNALFVLIFKQLAYILQAGVPEWDDETTYYTGQMVSTGSSQRGEIYVSLANDNTNHAITDTAWWRKLSGQVTSAKTSNVSLAAADNGCIIPCNTTGGAFNVDSPVGPVKNYSFTIKDIAGTFGSNPVTFVRAGSESIEGVAANYSCNKPNRAYTFVFDGTDWIVTVTTINTKPGVGEFIGESGTQTADANEATGLNIIGNTASRWAKIIQQKITTAGQSFGELIAAGTNASDYAQYIKNAALQDMQRLRGDGAFFLDKIHNLGAGNITSGRYTPTLTALANISAVTTYSCLYLRVGNIVIVSGEADVTATTAANTRTTLAISIPIASPALTTIDLTGSGTHKAATGTAMAAALIEGDTTNKRGTIDWSATNTSSQRLTFTFQYEVK